MTTTSRISRVSTAVNDPESVDTAIASRLSVREFLPTPLPRNIITDILRIASQAASGSNMQPWKVYVLQGESRAGLVAKVRAAHDTIYAGTASAGQYQGEFAYYPDKWASPYLERRRENGWGLYGLLGIGKADKDKMHAQHQRNFEFFNAPTGLMFTLDRTTGRGSLIDYGMFLQSLMVAARARGLHTCPQAAWNNFAKIVMEHIGADENEVLICGMSIGYADQSAQVNSFHPPRIPVEEFARWMD